MTEFSSFYKDGIDRLYVPDYSMAELRSLKRHKKYIRKKKCERLVAAVFFIFVFSIVATATAYAAYTIHKKSIRFTSYGVIIDFSNPESQADPDIPVSYTDIYKAPAFSQEDFTDENAGQEHTDIPNFDNWADALKVIDFPIAYPENMQYSELNIAIYQTAVFKIVTALYTAPKKAIDIKYTYYLNSNWGLVIDYNAQITDKIIYTNKYKYDFMITECMYGESKRTNVIAYVNDYTIEMFIYGYETDEIYEVLDKFDLSVYE